MNSQMAEHISQLNRLVTASNFHKQVDRGAALMAIPIGHTISEKPHASRASWRVTNPCQTADGIVAGEVFFIKSRRRWCRQGTFNQNARSRGGPAGSTFGG